MEGKLRKLGAKIQRSNPINGPKQNFIDRARRDSDVQKSGRRPIVRLAKKHDQGFTHEYDAAVPPKKNNGVDQKNSPEKKLALEACARRIKNFHGTRKNIWRNLGPISKMACESGQIFNPVCSVGILCSGGRFSYPSTLLMTAISCRSWRELNELRVTPRLPVLSGRGILGGRLTSLEHRIYRVGGPAALARWRGTKNNS